ncbi:hypothetical protein VTJ83DRAFT_1082 [Remersonia thermophila]|uniref:Single-stranded DNA-binding protein n=1 Tax=Remersonia thermophila TaxID=72144 RepID=A0ABR4DMZ0_9PEZI
MSAFLRSLARPATAARAFSTTAQRPVARITIVGNLADSPELRVSSTGREYLRYSLASNSGPANNRRTSWFTVRCFAADGPQREFFQSLPKGALLMVEGEVTVSNYNDEDGKPRQAYNITQRSLDVIRRPFNPNRQAPEEGEQQPQE